MGKVKQLREERQYSCRVMAEKLGISRTYYWQLEHNQRGLSYEMAVRIAAIFQKLPDDLFFFLDR